MKLFRLRGGVHPKTHKDLTSSGPIRTLPLPERLHVLLQQHMGAAATPLVRVGERVLKGQPLGARPRPISAAVHAPTSGRVTAIGAHPAPHPSGLPVPTVTIEADGEDRWLEAEPPVDPFDLTPEAIAERVGAAGVVGMGGATFPAAVKLELSRKARVRTLIINGSECEPYITCDDALMRERAAEVIAGIRLIRRAVGEPEVLVGIERNKPAAIAAMGAAAAGTGVRIVPVPVLYPMGWDRQLIGALTGREVPARGRSGDVGVLIHNVATAHAVYRAVALGRPLVSRVVTVSGGALAAPANLEVPIGTPAKALLDACDGLRKPAARLVLGGPMMGIEMPSPDVPVVKGTSGVLALTRSEIARPRPAPCIRCSTCVRACPVGLLPVELLSRVRAGDLDSARSLGIEDCIGCGSCAYACPAHIPLAHHFSYAKGELAAREHARQRQEATRQLAEDRRARLERIERERAEAAARRKAAKLEAAQAAAAAAP